MSNFSKSAGGSMEIACRLTLKQVRFIDHFVHNGGNASKAALQAGYANRQRGWELVSKSVIWQRIEVKIGYDSILDSAIAVLLRAMEAKKIVRIPVNYVFHDSVKDRKSVVMRKKMVIEVDDNLLQLKAADLASRLFGFYGQQADRKTDPGQLMGTLCYPQIYNVNDGSMLGNKSVE